MTWLTTLDTCFLAAKGGRVLFLTQDTLTLHDNIAILELRLSSSAFVTDCSALLHVFSTVIIMGYNIWNNQSTRKPKSFKVITKSTRPLLLILKSYSVLDNHLQIALMLEFYLIYVSNYLFREAEN